MQRSTTRRSRQGRLLTITVDTTSRKSGQPRSIAVLRALQLGDMLCAVPALRALRGAAPHARISLIGLPWASEFCARYPGYIDEFIPFPGYPGLPEQDPELDVIPLFIERMQARRFDMALQLHGSGAITNPLTLLFAAKRTAGFYMPDAFCPDEASFVPYPDDLPERTRLLKLVEVLGGDAGDDRLEFSITEDDRAEVEALGVFEACRGRIACLHPGARHPVRRWPPAKFAAVGDALAERGFAVVITGSAWERSIAGEVQRAMRTPALNVAGMTSLGAAGALLAASRVVVCNDTGLSHLADAVGTPSVVVFTGSDPERWAPADSRRHRVLRGINVEPKQVIDEAVALLETEAAHAA